MPRKTKAVRPATLGVMTALSFIFGYLETLIPPFTGIPGIKPGFANIPVMIAMYLLGWKEAAVLGIVRVVLSGLTFSGVFAMLYSLAGSVLSIIAMLLIKKLSCFSTTAVSICGGVAHNIGQVIVACAVTGSAVLYYLPVLIISGLVAGLITGIISGLVLTRLGPAVRSIIK